MTLTVTILEEFLVDQLKFVKLLFFFWCEDPAKKCDWHAKVRIVLQQRLILLFYIGLAGFDIG